MIDRRSILREAAVGAAGLALGVPARLLAQGGAFAPRAPLEPILARHDRLFRVSVCLRPFRASGPRIELERIGSKQVVHHYGHGGSGWSLSWGSAAEAVPLALATGAKEVAVIGAGAIGLTTAITAQRMGLKVTIYTRARFPDIRSARATGTWSPHSRIAMEGAVDPAFADRWEQMARRTYAIHQSYLGLPGNPVEWIDRYSLSDTPFEKRPRVAITMPDGRTDRFVDYEERVKDLQPLQETLVAGTHPFPVANARRTTSLMYNVADLTKQLESDFQLAGGRFVPFDMRDMNDLTKIRERVIIACLGFDAREAFKDPSIIPVRGQLAWLLPQPGARYGLQYDHVSLLSRTDGIVVQRTVDDGDGFNVFDEAPDYAAAHASIDTLARAFVPRVPA